MGKIREASELEVIGRLGKAVVRTVLALLEGFVDGNSRVEVRDGRKERVALRFLVLVG